MDKFLNALLYSINIPDRLGLKGEVQYRILTTTKAYRSERSAPKPIYRHGARSAQRPASFACRLAETNRQRRRPALTSRDIGRLSGLAFDGSAAKKRLPKKQQRLLTEKQQR